jgi:hypothetical protein
MKRFFRLEDRARERCERFGKRASGFRMWACAPCMVSVQPTTLRRRNGGGTAAMPFPRRIHVVFATALQDLCILSSLALGTLWAPVPTYRRRVRDSAFVAQLVMKAFNMTGYRAVCKLP